jgi:hypothetical protein
METVIIRAHFLRLHRKKPGFSGVPPLARPLRAPTIPCAPRASKNGFILEPAQGYDNFFGRVRKLKFPDNFIL